MKLEQSLKQTQKLILSPQMQQALHLLQLPVAELSALIAEELAHNPILEYADEPLAREKDDLRAFVENTLAYETSLFDHLMTQASELDPTVAELVIGTLDHDGFLTTPLEELSLLYDVSLKHLKEVLAEVQTFEPPGVGASNLRESLLIQLRMKGKKHTLAYTLVADHFDAVLHNRIPHLTSLLNKTRAEIRGTIETEIASLDFHPGAAFPSGHYTPPSHTIIPDLMITSGGGVAVNQEGIPELKLNDSYLEMLDNPSLAGETHHYIEEKVAAGKWLLRNLNERHQTLLRISSEIAHKQHAFFTRSTGTLVPLTMKEIAEELGMHESTVARAVAGKYVDSPRGILPLRSFFTHAYTTEEGTTISSTTVRGILTEIINAEDRRSPLSDQAISEMIQEKGIPCARRTIAKYRKELGIGNTTQRKIF